MRDGKLGYGDIRYLPQLLKIAFHEAQAHPDRLTEIAEALANDARQLDEAYTWEIKYIRSRARAAEAEAKHWEQKYYSARHRIKLQAQRITAHWVSDQLRDGFDPRGFFVYMLWESDTADCPIYVGRSGNVCGRIGSHLNKSYGHRIACVSLIRCDSEEQMCITEQELIDLYQPELNRAGKRVEPPLEPIFAGRYSRAGEPS